MTFSSAQIFLMEPLSQRCSSGVSCTWSSRSLSTVSTVCIKVCTMDSTIHPCSRNGRLGTID